MSSNCDKALSKKSPKNFHATALTCSTIYFFMFSLIPTKKMLTRTQKMLTPLTQKFQLLRKNANSHAKNAYLCTKNANLCTENANKMHIYGHKIVICSN